MAQWRLDDGVQTLVLSAPGGGIPAAIYWGAPLPEDEDLAALARAHIPDFTGGALDAVAPLSICPEGGRGFPGQPGMRLSAHDGTPLTPHFLLRSVEARPGALDIACEDDDLGLGYHAHFHTDPDTGIITARAVLEAAEPVRLHWLAAPVLPAPQSGEEMLDFAGRWCGEMQVQRSPWNAGIRLRESRLGRSDHAHFPALILPERGTINTRGTAFALHYGWSGGHRMLAEELPDGRRQIQFGNAVHSETDPGIRFETAPLYLTRSDAGLNGCAIAFPRHLRDRIVTWPAPERPRPVHYNCWEAVYFDHDLATLKDIASRAAALGAERFVLDDGWFRDRGDDTSSLGDWQVDAAKFPDGLAPLIDHVEAEGMRFGLWVEPEMVSPDSDLYRAHPGWALGPADQITGRHQLVLNLALEPVRDNLFIQIGALLRRYRIEYLKWDHNRVLPGPDAAQTRGLYALLARLRAEFPTVEIESCASGGGRIDFGMLAHTQRVWLSDSNDALERLRIQHDAALFLPGAVTGSHVGPRKCHTSGRVLDMRFRAWVAATRHMGFEMDPRELNDEESGILRAVTAWWKDNRDWLMSADIHRLDPADPAILAEQHIATDGHRLVAFIAPMTPSDQSAPRPIRLTALDPVARYRVSLTTRADIGPLSRANPTLKGESLVLSGQYLMTQGLTLPWAFPATIHVVEGLRL